MEPKELSSSAQKFLELWPRLAEWYGQGARDLPWRRPPVDVYRIWISEVMSQQSTLKTVIPYFARWMELFPSIEDLANAPQEDVLKAWAGLGYYSRARNVHATAQNLVAWRSAHGGEWPKRTEEWLSFKGIGLYTASAVAAIAFHDRSTPVDGNVLRVGARFFGIPDPLNTALDRKSIELILNEGIQRVESQKVPVFAQSLMELGALVCRPGTQALCELCPLQASCVARLQKRTAEWPLPKKRPLITEELLLAKILWDGKDQMLFRQIPTGERLEGQWELPLESVNAAQISELTVNNGLLGPVKHSITRYRFKVWGQMESPLPKKLPQGQVLDSWRSPQRHLTTLTLKLLLKLDSLLN